MSPTLPRDPGALVDACERESLALLRDNLAPEGILAAGRGTRAKDRGYDRVFSRDAAVCVLAMAASGDVRLEHGARASLATLAEHQAQNGQIPKFVETVSGSGDFWYLGCIDATLWWLIALDWLERHGAGRGLARKLAPQARRALAWLACQEHPRIHLLQQNEASDWADIMPRSGFVLYTNALWYRVKRRYGVAGADLTKRHFNQLFAPGGGEIPEYKRLRLLVHYARKRKRHIDLYLSFVNLASWGEEGDVFGNLLASLLGLADGARSAAMLRAIECAQQGARYPVRVICDVIRRNDDLWRAYMGRHKQNLEHQYHNGGIWPMVGGFWIAALAARGRKVLALQELARLASANAVNGWEFNEWFHGLSGRPSGMPRQSWNAATFLLARRSLTQRIF